MADQKFGAVLHTIGSSGGNDPSYSFINHDEYKVQLVNLKEPSQNILIDKQALLEFVKVFNDLGKKFTV